VLASFTDQGIRNVKGNDRPGETLRAFSFEEIKRILGKMA
jgi:uncharacterized protein with GYD domain